jgi:hypothetical protein
MFVLDLADNLLDDVLDRHQPVGAAELVDDDCHVGAPAAHVGKQVEHRHRGRNEQHRPRHGHGRRRPRAIAREERVGQHRIDVFDQQHPRHLIKAFAVERKPAVPGFAEPGDDGREIGGLVHGKDGRARHGDLADLPARKHQHVAQHQPLGRVEIVGIAHRIVTVILDRLLDGFAKRPGPAQVEKVAHGLP